MSHPTPGQTSGPVYNAPFPLHHNYIRPDEPATFDRRNIDSFPDTTIGPMPVYSFIRNFLTLGHTPDTSYLLPSIEAFSGVPSRSNTFEGISKPLLKALQRQVRCQSRCPGFVFRESPSEVLRPHRLEHLQSRICCYAQEHLECVQTTYPTCGADLGYAELFIDIKPDPTHDYFTDPPEHIEDEDRATHDFLMPEDNLDVEERRYGGLARHIAAVTEILARQFRVFLFSISLSGSRARLLRWDRTGCIVTESFDIREQPELLCEFLWRFSRATQAGRGHDPTVERASLVEESIFQRAVTEHVRSQLALKGAELEEAGSEHYLPGYAVAVHVIAQNQPAASQHIHRYIVSRPVVSPDRPTGRGTKGFWAVDPQTGRTVFLKDTWRAMAGLEKEGCVLERLNEKHVRHVPTLICHGDVPDYIPESERTFAPHEFQVTETDEYQGDPWVCKGQLSRLFKHAHYRVVLGTAGYGLRHLKGTEELLHATYDVYHAMRDAFDKGSRLHRDISQENIVLIREPGQRVRRGVLIDWETSCQVDDSGKAIEAERVGTWLFMSERMLTSMEDKRHTFQDDMEALLYVVLYCSLLWLPHNLREGRLYNAIQILFEHHHYIQGRRVGGEGKRENALSRTHTDSVAFNSALKEWLDTVMEFHSPLTHSRSEYGDRWSNPEYLDTFWAEFLAKDELDRDDRVVHLHPHTTGVPHIPIRSPSPEDIVVGRRPTLKDDEDQCSPPLRKKARHITVPPSSPPPLQQARRSTSVPAATHSRRRSRQE